MKTTNQTLTAFLQSMKDRNASIEQRKQEAQQHREYVRFCANRGITVFFAHPTLSNEVTAW